MGERGDGNGGWGNGEWRASEREGRCALGVGVLHQWSLERRFVEMKNVSCLLVYMLYHVLKRHALNGTNGSDSLD